MDITAIDLLNEIIEVDSSQFTVDSQLTVNGASLSVPICDC
jgi:hypothetical protein